MNARTPTIILKRALLRMAKLFLFAFLFFNRCMAGEPAEKIIGMYVHQHWPYHHPYAARTWTLEDWRGYADALKKLGYNTMLIWPVLETMPEPLTRSDKASLRKIAAVIDLLHRDFGMKAYIVLCPNVVAKNEEASRASFENRHFFSCDQRVNPGDPVAVKQMINWRAKLLAPLARTDGIVIIDSDPGGYPNSSNEEFVNLLATHREMFDTLRTGIELIYWMHEGWRGYGRFYETGILKTSTAEEQTETLALLKARNLEPWGLANGLAYATTLGIADRVVSFNYGRIEGEPSFPMSNFGGKSACEGGAMPGPRGVMGNAQTHCIQLPNTFAFARGAAGESLTDVDYIGFAEDLLPSYGETIFRAWKTLAGRDEAAMRVCATELTKISRRHLKSGPLKGFLFGNPRRFVNDLAMMLRVRAGFLALQTATEKNSNTKESLEEFITATKSWQHQHGYENSMNWAGLDVVLRKLNSPEVNAVLDNRFNPFVPPKLRGGETPFAAIARQLKDEESYTIRLLQALEVARRETRSSLIQK